MSHERVIVCVCVCIFNRVYVCMWTVSIVNRTRYVYAECIKTYQKQMLLTIQTISHLE